jgi:DNA-binding FadR family transcriptional regulator
MLKRYGIARGTLRETLRMLELQGIIEMKTGPGGGPVVSQPGSRHLAGLLAAILQLRGTTFEAVLEARRVLEPVLAAKAAERIVPEQADQLRRSVERIRADVGDLDLYLLANEEFHSLIAEFSGNELFSLMLSSFAWISDASALGVTYSLRSRKVVCDEHEEICEAIARGEAERAAEAMTKHIDDFATYLERKYPDIVKARLRWDLVD